MLVAVGAAQTPTVDRHFQEAAVLPIEAKDCPPYAELPEMKSEFRWGRFNGKRFLKGCSGASPLPPRRKELGSVREGHGRVTLLFALTFSGRCSAAPPLLYASRLHVSWRRFS